MRLGIHLPQYGRASSADAITRVAQRAETLGYADVWVSDHVVVPADQGYPSPYLFEPLLSLAWAAAATDRVRLGTSVLVVPHHHPLSMANALASLDKLSGGRLTLGVGVGWSAAEFAALDQDFASRGARMDEALDIYRAAWETDPVSHDGGHYDFADMKLQPKPEARIPIWVGGLADVAIRRAARHDGYQGISSSPEEMKAIVQGGSTIASLGERILGRTTAEDIVDTKSGEVIVASGVLLDEPMTGLDPVARAELADTIRALPQRGVGVLVSSHVLHELEAVVDRVVLVHQGRLLADGRIHELRDRLPDRPHRLRLRAAEPRALAAALTMWPQVEGVAVHDDAVEVALLGQRDFYERLTALASEWQGGLHEITPLDDDLAAVFGYLVE